MRVKKRPMLSEQNKQERFRFAQDWLNKTSDKLIFSDETSVELEKSYIKFNWRKRGESLREANFKPKNIQYVKYYRKFWGSITKDGPGTLIPVKTKWNGDTYIYIF